MYVEDLAEYNFDSYSNAYSTIRLQRILKIAYEVRAMQNLSGRRLLKVLMTRNHASSTCYGFVGVRPALYADSMLHFK
jgi:hypothetical protein